jgi:2'-5' RNA ligase
LAEARGYRLDPVRLFFGVGVTETIRARFAALAEELREKAKGAPVSWEAPEKVHLTLRFLGEVDESRLPALLEAGTDIASSATPFGVVLEKLGTFGGRAAPRVIWVGVRDDAGKAALEALALALERKVRALGFPGEERPFSAHATLGRVREKGKRSSLGPLVAAVAEKSAFEAGALPVDRFILYESRMRGSRPPEYVEAASFALTLHEEPGK